ncbi:MATE family efflux transporter [bacterium DOLJORAL78_65_58]|nr:MAG: MATE family efflux transporter [bacterium DOLZORAL124_64_63]PIE76843.1 MAG: MATE family efflux transporter [bacterium DOLJORAL78_65_58]
MNRLTTEPIPALIRELAIPASVGMFLNTMYNVVDIWYAGRYDTDALAALSLTFPIFFILLATGMGMSNGATALIGNALGRGDRREAALIAAQGVVLGWMIVGLVVVVGYVWGPDAYRLLGAEGPYLRMCVDYLSVILPGSVFVFTFNMFTAPLNATGDTRAFRDFLLGATIANIILDPMLMYGWLGLPAMGIRGIALATVIAQGGGMVFLGLRARRTGLLARSEGARWAPDPKVLRAIVAQGLPSSLNMMTVALGVFVITYFLADFGQQAVAAYGAATRIEQLVLLPALGLNVAALSLTSQNFGARKFERIRQVAQTSLKYGALLMMLGTVLIYFGSGFLMKLFTPDPQVVAIGSYYLRIAAFLEFSYVVLFVNTSILQGLKRPNFGFWIGVSRQLVAPITLFTLFTRVFDLGLHSIWWGIFGINWAAAVISGWWARRQLGKLEETSGPLEEVAS